MSKKRRFLPGLVLMFVFVPKAVFGMHIMEGFLPPFWCISWGVVVLPFLLLGLFSIQKMMTANPRLKILLAMVGAFAFLLSALKIPSVTGSSSHLTGIGLGAILFGPTTMTVIGFIVLLFQAVLLAHGGLTTLGANIFSMAVVGPVVAFVTYKIILRAKGSQSLAVFFAAFLGDLTTYITAAIQLALAFPAEVGGFGVSLAKFMSIFGVTQIPLAISEGIITVLVFNAIQKHSRTELNSLNIFEKGRL